MNRSAVIEQLEAWGVECYTRTEWGTTREAAYVARRRTHPMPVGPADFHFLHITVTRDSDTIREGMAGARQVETYGYSNPPMWSYQEGVTNEGRYFQGQDYGTKGTHTVNDKNVPGFPRDLNLVGYACALMQNVADEVTDVQVDVVARVFAARELAGFVNVGAPIYPHRKFAAKSCPGDLAMLRLDEIRRLKNHYVQTAHHQQEDEMANSDEILSELKALRSEEKTRAVMNGKRAVRDVAFMKLVKDALLVDVADRGEILEKIDDLIADVEQLVDQE